MSANRVKARSPKKAAGGEDTRWKPGQSGNPGGRPSRKPMTDELEKICNEPWPGDREGRTTREVLLRKIIHRAVNGRDPKYSLAVTVEIMDRIEGKSIARQEVSGPDQGPINIEGLESREENLRRVHELLQKAALRRKSGLKKEGE